ncbi:HNH endonuclease [Companilactobacillus pabuli]|uniref:HNH endonuclease n=1 Tax=Companilactobacillus pabuli TaxID=2714036 RepID=A0A7L7L1E0_9LACO|nr:HNH endonuclease signature motif containing protein [Companilactobacillus pabuli]AKP03060.1 hypothetical protein ABB45_05140 [Companilactobacillus farciminis]AKS51360.1 hypothetical protein ABB44_05150 [Companilactobacillus farciminis]MDG5112147.1 HNH endonuclease signature motif containing protein [Companilactobacillus pabuli]QMT85258.1 HNH endonuclease [Companilactobacillus pabuli]GAQ02273.1 hypothetical protein NBRC111452_2116 [Companilactobacillus farciminis]
MYGYQFQTTNPKTNYFIIDSSSSPNHNDVDFKYYSYQNQTNKQLHSGDLIIYRRSGSASEWGNEFYLYGAAQLGDVVQVDPTTGNSLLEVKNPYLFSHRLMKQNLRTFDWKFRKFKGKWSNFFNMNGITQITKEDYFGLLERQSNLSPEFDDLSSDEELLSVKCYQAQRHELYTIEDTAKGIPTRRAADKYFSDQVKFNYRYKSALIGTSDEDELVATRIIPWEDNKTTRLDYRNGICLTKILKKAFTQGYFTFSDQGHIILSDLSSDDPELNKTLNKYKNRKIHMNREYSPNKNYLQYHREHIFKR